MGFRDFLSAIFAGVSPETPIRARLGYDAEIVNVTDAAFFTENEGQVLVSPLTDAGMAFVMGVVDDPDGTEWQSCRLAPTAVIRGGSSFVLIWALDVPFEPGERLDNLIGALGITNEDGSPAVDEFVPVPPYNAWEIVHVDGDRYYTFDEVEAAYGGAPVIEGPVFNDAKIIAPFNPDDPQYQQPMAIMLGKRSDSKQWKRVEFPLIRHIDKWTRQEEGTKDGMSFVLADMVEGQRLKNAVKSNTGAGLDIDVGTPTEQIDAALLELGCFFIRYTTHSHAKTKTEFKKDKIVKWAAGADIEDDEVIRRFLREDQKWDESIVASATYDGTEHTSEGIKVTINHAPMPKNRIIIPFAEPFVIADEGATQIEAQKKWAKIPVALADKLGVPLDTTGTDPSRLFYFPRHKAGAPYSISIGGGPLFDWRTLELDNPYEALANAVDKGGSKSVTDAGKALGRWSKKAAHGFQIEDAIKDYCPEKIRGPASSGSNVECPFDDDHSNAGDPDDQACFVVNAGEGTTDFFTFSCRHESCRDKTFLDMFGKMLEDGSLPRSVLEDDRYNGIEEDTPKASEDEAPKANERLTTTNVTARLMALGKKPDPEAVQKILNEIAAVADDGERERLFVAATQTLPKPQHPMVTTAKKAARRDWRAKRRADRLKDMPKGKQVFDFDDADELVKAINAKCQLAPYGNEMRFVFWDEKTGAPIFRRERDAKNALAQYKYWNNEHEDDPGFSVWLKHPDRYEYARVVFNPNVKDTDPSELNLFSGWAVEPKPGNWSLMRAHILDNICQGNKEHFRFLLAVIAQMFQEPERKIGIVIVLRGEKGVGKSILADWLVEIIGPRHAVVADKAEQVTGKFNAQLRYNILVSAEEAFFAGDPQMRGPLKHLATGRTMSYEAKGVDIVQERNYTRIFITTNEDWAVPAEPGERRLFVLDVGNAHIRDSVYFDAITEQMKNGGAAAMLHDLLQCKYAGVDFANMPMTDALANQIRQGLSAPMRWFENVLVEGCLPFREGVRRDTELGGEGVQIAKDDVVASYCEYVPSHPSRPITRQDVGNFLTKHVPGLGEVKRTKGEYGPSTRYLVFPALDAMRAAFLKAHPGYKFPAQPVASPEEPETDADAGNVVQFSQAKGA